MILMTAIQSLRPNAKFIIRGENIEWLDVDQTQPTKEEIALKIAQLQEEYALKKYQRQRASEYPPLTDLADAMYWASQGDNSKLDAYYAACEAVKLKYPKAE